MSSRIPGFYELSIAARRHKLAEATGLDEGGFAVLERGGIDIEIADGMIENVVGTYALPFAVALNFRVNGRDYVVPMVVEEPSVVAAASGAAKIIRQGGGFSAKVSDPLMIGQVQLVHVADPEAAKVAIETHKDGILARARRLVPRLVDRGGGPMDLEVRILDMGDGGSANGGNGSSRDGMLVVHLLVDCRDAMGANLINTLAEGIADDLAAVSGAKVGLRILSNLADQRTAHVTVRIADAVLGEGDAAHGALIREGIVSASRFAELDPYRAATHNKGIMNGVDAVLLATANDWRGVEAGAHAYACRSGQYGPLAVWKSDGDALVGTLDMPMAVGTVGGALHVHEGARLALAMLGVRSAGELAAVVASAGLASNFAALRALSTHGIQRGHMSLHARLLARAAGATGEDIERVATELSAHGEVKLDRAKEILRRLGRSELVNIATAEESL